MYSGGTASFTYGLTSAHGSATAAVPLTAGGGHQATSATLTGLSPATAYHARLVATNPDGTAASTDVTFTTASPPPATPATPATPVARHSRHPRLSAPVLSGAHLTHSRFRVAGQATAVSARKSRARQDTTVQFTLSTAARRCTRTLAVGTLIRARETAGADRLAFSGRLGGGRWRPAATKPR